MTKGELAKEYFESGRNCSQSVALAFSKELNLTEDQIKKLTIGFGGGFARSRLVCGAVSGMTLVLSALISDGEDRKPIYEILQSAYKKVKEELGSLICQDLLNGVKVTDGANPEPRNSEYYAKRPCAEICKIIADITQEILEENR